MNKNKIKEFVHELAEKDIKLVCAESITGGLLASSIVSIPGASSVLLGSIVSYNKDFKNVVLDVSCQIINEKTAESLEVTTEMVNGIVKLFPAADLYIAVTGVASLPVTDYHLDKTVGQIYIAIIYKGIFYSFSEVISGNDRNLIREGTVEAIINYTLEIVRQ